MDKLDIQTTKALILIKSLSLPIKRYHLSQCDCTDILFTAKGSCRLPIFNQTFLSTVSLEIWERAAQLWSLPDQNTGLVQAININSGQLGARRSAIQSG